jgi:hypothetical protein
MSSSPVQLTHIHGCLQTRVAVFLRHWGVRAVCHLPRNLNALEVRPSALQPPCWPAEPAAANP